MTTTNPLALIPQLESLDQRYDADHDIHDDGLMVSYTEKVLIDIARDLLINQAALFARIAKLEEQLNGTASEPQPPALNLGPAASRTATAREILWLSDTMMEIPIIHNQPESPEPRPYTLEERVQDLEHIVKRDILNRLSNHSAKHSEHARRLDLHYDKIAGLRADLEELKERLSK